MGKLDDIIKIASDEVGYKEGTNNDNKYGIEYGWNNVAWCVQFAWWCATRAGIDFPKVAHCNQVESYAKDRGKWVTHDFEVGDFVIFDYDMNGERDHIGLVVGIGEGDSVTTIEGNYSDSVATVLRRTREFIGAYRPDYKESPTSATTAIHTNRVFGAVGYGDIGTEVFFVQSALKLLGYDCGAVDGEIGPITSGMIKNFQFDYMGKDAEDGIAGSDTFHAIIDALKEIFR